MAHELEGREEDVKMVSIDFVKNSKTVVVKIDEEIDHHVCEKIKNKIDLAVDFRKASLLIFDFAGVNFMDSSGIGLIMGRYKNISKSGGQAVIVNLKPSVRKILQLSGIFRILKEEDSVESVLRKIKTEV